MWVLCPPGLRLPDIQVLALFTRSHRSHLHIQCPLSVPRGLPWAGANPSRAPAPFCRGLCNSTSVDRWKAQDSVCRGSEAQPCQELMVRP